MIKPISKNLLYTKPIKSMPKGLIYHNVKDGFYNLIETKTGKIVGTMDAYLIEPPFYTCYKIKPDEYEFHIGSLEINRQERRKGWGKYFIDFAKKESANLGCKGRVSLLAYNEEKPPHIFYKKQGFKALSEADDAILNEYLRVGIEPAHMRSMDMYLPIDDCQKSEPFIKTNANTRNTSFFLRLIDWLLR